jgi:hypothetical protein
VKSEVRFVLHRNDEATLEAQLLSDPAVLLVDGPRWKTATPPRNLSTAGWYVLIWSPQDLAELPAEFIPACNDWYCKGKYATIQFLRSQTAGTVITEGRFAISTAPTQKTAAANVERRYRLLRRAVQRSYMSLVTHRWRLRVKPRIGDAYRSLRCVRAHPGTGQLTEGAPWHPPKPKHRDPPPRIATSHSR